MYVHNITQHHHMQRAVCLHIESCSGLPKTLLLRMYILISSTHVCMYSCIHVFMYSCMYVCMYVHVCTRMYVCMYVCWISLSNRHV